MSDHRSRWITFSRLASAVAVLAAFVVVGSARPAFAQPTPTVMLVPNAAFGMVLTDSGGWTLYTWDADQEGVSNCYDACAVAWPAYTIETDLIAPDDLPSSLGLIDRGDGTWQVTIDNWPLYYFARDANPGDINGDGINAFGAQWYVTAFAAPQQAAPPPPPVAQNPPPPPPPAPTIAPAPPIAPSLAANPAPNVPSVPSVPARAAQHVSISNFQFLPPTINIQQGDTVTWMNDDRQAHTVTSDTGLFDSGPLQSGQSFSFTFNNPGTFSYHCGLHPNMRGTVIVGSGSTFGGQNGPFGGPTGPFNNQVPLPFPPDQFGGAPGPIFPPPPGGTGQFQTQLIIPAPTNGSVILSWVPNPAAQSYRIYQTNVLQPTALQVVQTVPQTPGILATQATVSGLVPGQTYVLQVRAVEPTGGELPAPAQVLLTPGGALPGVPTALAASAVTANGVALSWTPVPGATNYRVLMSTNPAGPFTAQGGIVTGNTANVAGVTPNTMYYFQVVALDPAGNQSAPSNTVTVNTVGGLAAPTNVSVTAVTNNTATLTWASVTNATTYRVMVSTSAAGPFTTQANVTNSTATGATVTGLSPLTPYYFQVVAVDANNNAGTASSTVNAVTTL